MRNLLQLLAACLLCLSCAQCEYNYDRPQVTFNAVQQQHGGANGFNTVGNRFVTEVMPSRKIFEARYLAVTGGVVQQPQYQQQGAGFAAQGYAYNNNYNAHFGRGFVQQPQPQFTQTQIQQPPYAQTHFQQAQPQQVHQQQAQFVGGQQYSSLGLNAPAPAQQYATNFGQAQSGFNAAQTQSYTPNSNPLVVGQPQQVGYAGAAGNQFVGNAALSAHQYAASVAANVATQYGPNAETGNYIGQSQVTQLDNYPYKQHQAGDARGFQRIVRTCNAKGQCSQISLGPGQEDALQQQLIYATRARISTVSNKCQKKAEAAAVASYYRVPQAPVEPARPKDRRQFPYSEVSLPGDPYN